MKLTRPEHKETHMTTSTVRSISPVDPCALPSNLLGTHKEYEDHEVEAYEVQVGDSMEIVYVTWYSQPSPGVLGRAGVSIGCLLYTSRCV